jgi:predicted branched-subunit amino acid permease
MDDETNLRFWMWVGLTLLLLFGGLSGRDPLPLDIAGLGWFCGIFVYQERKRRVALGAFALVVAVYVHLFGWKVL